MSVRALVLIGVLGLTSLARAQDSSAVGSRWRIGVSGSHDVAYRTLVVKSSDAWIDDHVALRDDSDGPKNTFTLGLDVRFGVGRHWVLASGVQFMDRGYKSVYSGFISADPIEIDPAIPKTLVSKWHFQYFSLPVSVHYTFGHGKVHFEPGAGIMLDLLHSTYSNNELEFADGRIATYVHYPSYHRYRRVALSACAELNAHLALAKRWELRVAPRMRYQLIPSSGTDVADRLWEAGLVLGCFYSL